MNNIPNIKQPLTHQKNITIDIEGVDSHKQRELEQKSLFNTSEPTLFFQECESNKAQNIIPIVQHFSNRYIKIKKNAIIPEINPNHLENIKVGFSLLNEFVNNPSMEKFNELMGAILPTLNSGKHHASFEILNYHGTVDSYLSYEQLNKLFSALKITGKITQPLAKAFKSATLGKLIKDAKLLEKHGENTLIAKVFSELFKENPELINLKLNNVESEFKLHELAVNLQQSIIYHDKNNKQYLELKKLIKQLDVYSTPIQKFWIESDRDTIVVAFFVYSICIALLGFIVFATTQLPNASAPLFLLLKPVIDESIVSFGLIHIGNHDEFLYGTNKYIRFIASCYKLLTVCLTINFFINTINEGNAFAGIDLVLIFLGDLFFSKELFMSTKTLQEKFQRLAILADNAESVIKHINTQRPQITTNRQRKICIVDNVCPTSLKEFDNLAEVIINVKSGVFCENNEKNRNRFIVEKKNMDNAIITEQELKNDYVILNGSKEGTYTEKPLI